MIILFDTEEKVYGFRTEKLGFTISRHGRPFGDLWNEGWTVSLYKKWFPYGCILKYENI